MRKEMSQVKSCEVEKCAYNMDHKCHTMAITVGDGKCPACDTSMETTKKAGMKEVNAGVGACKVAECRFNDSLECQAEGIDVKMHSEHPECTTFESR